MDQHVIDPNDAGILDVTQRLEAYADARLSPTIAATTRVRMNVMNAAHRRAALIAADGGSTTVPSSSDTRAATPASVSPTTWRRPVAAAFAGFLTLCVLFGTALGVRAGGPLYEARLWTEMANLPADLVARAEAEVNRLDERLHEAQLASTAGDSQGTRAALVAYSTIVVEAAMGSGGDPTANAAIEVSVTRHVVVLTLMVDRVPEPARAAVQQALSSGTMVLDDLERAG